MERIKNLESKNIEKENEQIKETNERHVVKAKVSENNENTDKAEQEQSVEMNSNDPDIVTTPMLETEGDKLMNGNINAHKHHLHFKCDKCDYIFKKRCCLMKHTHSKHEVKKDITKQVIVLKCSLCDENFNTIKGYQ